MPTFTIQAPDGRKITIQAADQATALRGAQQWATANPARGSSPQGATDPITGYLTTAARAVPGLTELGAGYSAALRSADDLVNGRKLDFGGRFNQARAEQQGTVDQFQAQHPFASANATGLGTVAPAAIAAGPALARAAATVAPRVVARGIVPATGRALATGARNAATGAAVGSVYGFAQPGDLQQRTQNAFAAMGPGAAAGVAAPIVLGAGGKLAGAGASGARKAINAMRPEVEAPAAPASVTSTPQAQLTSTSTAAPAAPASVASGAPPPAAPAGTPGLSPVETSALGKFVRAVKPDTDAMASKANAFRDVGIQPTLVDTTGRGGQSVVRAVASRGTTSLDNAENFANARRTNIGGRMGAQAREIISSDPRTPEQIAKSVADARTTQANADFGPIRPVEIKLTPDMARALTSQYGRVAIGDAAARMLDPAEEASTRQLLARANQDKNLDPADRLKGLNITIGQAQDISRALFDKANAASVKGERDALTSYGSMIREGAKAQSPDYVTALSRFANASTLEGAPEIGRAALSPATDTFLTDLENLRQAYGPNGEADAGSADLSGDPRDPVGIALARPGFRRAIELQAGNASPGTASLLAEKLATATEQQQRNAAILGDDDADRLQNAMRLERQAVLNSANASPGAGSNTFLNFVRQNSADGGNITESVGSGLSLLGGHPIPAAMQALRMYLSTTRGFSTDEADALANMAIAPAKHDQALQFSASRAGPQAAQAAAPMMQNVAAGAAAAATAPPTPQAPPNAFQPDQTPPY